MVNKEMLTVMFIDIANYSGTSGKLNLDALNELHNIFDSLVLRTAEEYDGKIVKKVGDAFLVTFKTATSAINCGVSLQEKFIAYNKGNPYALPLKIRVAIHTGEVLHRNNDIYGDAVNIASRIEKVTKPGDILFSGSVYSTMDKNDIPQFMHLGTKKFKGIKKSTRIFKIKTRKDLKREGKKKVKKIIGKIIKWAIFLGAIYLIINIVQNL